MHVLIKQFYCASMSDIKLTPQLSAFILNVKKYISQKKLSLDEFFFEIKLSNPKRITQQEFIRIVQRINESGQPVNSALLFTQLSKGSPVIARETFVSSFFKVFKIDRIHLQGQSMCLKPKASRIIQKTPTPINPIQYQNKRIALFGFTRLKHHMEGLKQKLDKIFNDCDLNKSGAIDKLELNKLLFASGIKQFKDKNVRRLLVHHVFDDLLKKEYMGKQQFFSLFQFRKEVKSSSIKREAKTVINSNMRKSQVKTIKYQYNANTENTPQPLRRGGENYYVIKIQPNHKIITINQPGNYYNPEDEDVNDYINNYLDDLPAYDPIYPDPYGYDPMPDPFGYDYPQINPKKPKKPKIKPINPIYDDIDDPIYNDPYNAPYNQPYDEPYDDPYGQDGFYDNPKIKPKKPKIKLEDPYNNNNKKKKQQSNVNRPKFEIKNNKQNNVRAYPNAGKFFRLGIPSEEDKPYIQQLQRLISSNKTYQDNKNPKTNGEYVSSKEIFDQPFQLIEMSPEDMNSSRQDLKIGSFIQANDVNQGETGDCYFLCAIGSVAAEYPQLLSQLFLFQVNPACYYAVKLFVDGEWKIIKTDDLFVCRPHGGQIMNAKPNNNEIWVMLLEKCFAKIYGSFKAIDGGQQSEAFFALTGAPSHTIVFKQLKSQQAVKDRILNAEKNGYLMATAGTEYLNSLGEAKRQQIGLVQGHAYSMIFVKQIKGGITLVKLRNPWGRFEWKGDWSYGSNLWTPQLRNELGYNSKYEDGTFFMSWEDYYKYFGLIAICKVNPMNVHTSLRMVNNNHQSNYIRMNVVKQGLYDIFICQQAERRYYNQNYRCSNARVIILREGPNGKMDYAGSASQMNPVCSAQVRLTPGSYIVSAKVQWTLWDNHECFLSAYGVQKVTFQKLDRSIAPQFKQSIFPGFAFANRKNAKMGSYADSGNPGIQTETHLSPSDGLGYVKTINKTNRAYSIKVNYTLGGMKIAAQNNTSYVLNLRPGQEDVLGFFINSMGYHYTFSYIVK